MLSHRTKQSVKLFQHPESLRSKESNFKLPFALSNPVPYCHNSFHFRTFHNGPCPSQYGFLIRQTYVWLNELRCVPKNCFTTLLRNHPHLWSEHYRHMIPHILQTKTLHYVCVFRPKCWLILRPVIDTEILKRTLSRIHYSMFPSVRQLRKWAKRLNLQHNLKWFKLITYLPVNLLVKHTENSFNI